MKIFVDVALNSKENKLIALGNSKFLAQIREEARGGRANIALVKLISKEFGTNWRNILIKNPTSRKKIIEILE